jgi:hypothetical protein
VLETVAMALFSHSEIKGRSFGFANAKIVPEQDPTTSNFVRHPHRG